MTKRKKRNPKGSRDAFIETAYALSCQLAGVPGPNQAPTHEQIRATIFDLTARKSGVPREVLKAMPEAEWCRVVEAHMPRSTHELAGLLADEWSRRIKEASRLVMPGLDEAASLAAAARTVQEEKASRDALQSDSVKQAASGKNGGQDAGKVKVGISRAVRTRCKERFGETWRDVLRENLRGWEQRFKEQKGCSVWDYQGGGVLDESALIPVTVKQDEQAEAGIGLIFQIPGHGLLPHLLLPEEWRRLMNYPPSALRRAAYRRLRVSIEELAL